MKHLKNFEKTVTSFNHFINENEDVMVSDSFVPNDYYEIPHFDSFTIAQILANNSLYVVAKCYSLAFKEFKESTQAMTIEKWLISNGYNYDNKYYYNLKENIQKLGFIWNMICYL